MTIGDTSIFAIESEITRAFERPSWRGLGFFVIHVAGQRYGIKSPGQLVSQCWPGRGTHCAPFAEAHRPMALAIELLAATFWRSEPGVAPSEPVSRLFLPTVQMFLGMVVHVTLPSPFVLVAATHREST